MTSAPATPPPTTITDRPIHWGILGAGGIADNVCTDLVARGESVITAVAARDGARAADFAARHGALRSYGSYADLVADDEVDVVYIATTHPFHHDHALLAIEAGRSVLIEKPVCLSADDAREVFAASRAAGVFAMEAMWMRTNPLIRIATDLIAQGEIGEVVGARAEFGLGLPFDAGHRLYDPANGGGALLDLGVYPITFAYLFLGAPDEVLTRGTLAPTGVDETVAMEWMYDGVPRAQLWCSAPVPAPNLAAVLGSTGWIAVEGATHRPTALVVQSGENRYRIEDPIPDQHGYGPEIAEVERCLRAGLVESPLVTHADTIAILELMDQAQTELGVVRK